MTNIDRAKRVLLESDALFITAGAGMGVDSGLPDFRGAEGFWSAYPKARELGLSFEEMANPEWFVKDPHLAWAFYGHRLHLYRDISPHIGFAKLKKLSDTKRYGSFLFTSNIDGQFQKAGFCEDIIMECHGSIHHLQCIDDCCGKIWSADDIMIEIGDDFNAIDPLPLCPDCGHLARPNILMFGDFGWNYSRTDKQRVGVTNWISKLERDSVKVAILEIGAGTSIPTVRNSSEKIASQLGVELIRINTKESFGADIGIDLGGAEALDLMIDL